MTRQVVRLVRQRGFSGVVRALYSRVRSLLGMRAKSFRLCEESIRGKTGIEIGGPSQVFSRSGVFPVYPIAGRIDNCIFANTTVWEGEVREGQTFQYARDRPAGWQYVAEATALGRISTAAYDFVLASHVLEHIANPILALSEWTRVLKDEGTLVILLPHKDHTFDHRRPVTTMEHLIADHENHVTEDDLTHMTEILALHDLNRDPEAGDRASFVARSRRNFENRCFHHHVFDTPLAVRLVEYAGLQIHAVEEVPPMHILVVAQKARSAVDSGARQ
ncbi:MAG: methyltransferase domain-containing protein [Deltaproteobacteria bacterium]|nr:methyltransferase domain-containing protein [Deltaproteobacteria bacterium]MBI3391302.1 methyltransferase domain-containing protein [Deltaproteobacteria bacterium]